MALDKLCGAFIHASALLNPVEILQTPLPAEIAPASISRFSDPQPIVEARSRRFRFRGAGTKRVTRGGK